MSDAQVKRIEAMIEAATEKAVAQLDEERAAERVLVQRDLERMKASYQQQLAAYELFLSTPNPWSPEVMRVARWHKALGDEMQGFARTQLEQGRDHAKKMLELIDAIEKG